MDGRPLRHHARFTLAATVPWDEANATLELARLAIESLFGPGRVALEARWRTDASARTIALDASTEVGKALVLIFGGYAEREFGTDAVAARVVVEPLA